MFESDFEAPLPHHKMNVDDFFLFLAVWREVVKNLIQNCENLKKESKDGLLDATV